MNTAKILHEAINHNTVWLVKKLVEERQCSNLADEDGNLPLHTAVLENHSRIVRILIKNGADVDSRNRIGRTPLHEAANRGYLEIVNLLLENGASVHARTYYQWTALILAAVQGHVKVVQRLLEGGSDVEAQTSHQKPENGLQGMSALNAAASLPEPEVTHLLLRHGADPNTALTNGGTALQRAILKQRHVNAFLLYCYGALTETGSTVSKDSPLDQVKALPPDQAQKFKYLSKGKQPLHITAPRPETRGIGPDMKDLNVSKAMHLAVSASSTEVVAYLTKVYPEALEIFGPRNWRPLHRAARDNALGSVEVLLKNGAEVDSRTRNGWTALLLAAENGHDDVIRMLIQYHADPDARTGRGKTGVQVAENEKHFSTVSLLKVQVYKSSFKYVDPNEIVSKLNRTSLSPSHGSTIPGRPSSTEPESELDEDPDEEGFSFFDAKDSALQTDVPNSTDQLANPHYVDQYLKSLELIWYNKIQWSPQDDMESSKHSLKPGPVKIAILDTGIDLNHEDFKKPARRRTKIGEKTNRAMPEKAQRDRIACFRNFSDAVHPNDNVSDDDGHGTHVAGIILGIAPRAELYIAKIYSGHPDRSVAEPKTAKSPLGKKDLYDSIEAVSCLVFPVGAPGCLLTQLCPLQALLWCIEKKVDIIK